MERYDRPSGGYGQRPNRQALDGPSDRGSTRKAQAYGQSRLADRPRSRGAPSSEKRAAQDEIIEEFLEGLLDGFRMAGVGHRAEAPVPLQDPGNWLDLDAVPKAGASFESKKKLQNLLSRKSPSPSRGPPDDDALSVSLRRHALRAFLEETCGTVANAFDIMAGLALKASMGGSGTCDDRLHFTFHEEALGSRLQGTDRACLERIDRAWTAGLWAKAVLEERVHSPNRTPPLDLRSRYYAVAKCAGLDRPTIYKSSGSYWRQLGTLEGSSSVSQSFPSETEATIYLRAAGFREEEIQVLP
eukprot:s89_g31.t1